MKALFFVLFATLLCTGCTTVSAVKVTGADLQHYQRLFVERPLNENRHIDEMIVEELRKMGRDVSSGPLTMMPENTEAVVNYNARGSGDFGTYLIDFHLAIRSLHPNKPLVVGRYYQPSAFTKPPETVVRETIRRIYQQ